LGDVGKLRPVGIKMAVKVVAVNENRTTGGGGKACQLANKKCVAILEMFMVDGAIAKKQP
jgi:hypothetical protein